MNQKQSENYTYHTKELKMTGFGERLNDALLPKLLLPEDFRLEEKQFFEKANGELVPIQLFPDYSYNAEKELHYYNGVYAAMTKDVELPAKSPHVDMKSIIDLISKTLQHEAGNVDISIEHRQQVSTALQEVAAKDAALFHKLMVKFNPVVDFTLTDADIAVQQKIREDLVLAQYFPRKERLSATKMGYLLLGNFVHQVKYKDGVELRGWIALELEPNEQGIVPKTENDNHLYHRYDQKYGYNPAKALLKYNFKEAGTNEMISSLVGEMEKGKFVNLTPNDSKYDLLRFAADPTFKDFAIYSPAGKKIEFTDQFKHEAFRKSTNKMKGDDQPVTHHTVSASKENTPASGRIIETHFPNETASKTNTNKKKAPEHGNVARNPRKQATQKPSPGTKKSPKMK